MRAAHLFAGAGGSLLAGDLLGWEHVIAAEVDPYCRAVLAARWPGVELRGDVGTEPWGDLAGRVDLVVGGWPCQPVSSAGRRLASADHRDGWPALARAVRLLQPRYLFLENVAAVLTAERGAYFGRCLSDLAALGFDARWTVLRASDVGAPHRRERLWCFAWLADPGSFGWERRKDLGRGGRYEAEWGKEGGNAGDGGRSRSLAHPGGSGRLPAERQLRQGQPYAPGGNALADPGRGGLQRRREPGDLAGAEGSPQGEEDQWERLCAAVGDSCSTPLGGEQVADSPGDGLEGWATRERLSPWPKSAGGSEEGLSHPDVLRRERGPVPAGESAGVAPGRTGPEGDHEGPPESPLGRGADGLAAGLPWPGASGVWPAGRGQAQEAWEPPRTTGRVPLRRQQLKALGNGWVPEQAVRAWCSLTGDRP